MKKSWESLADDARKAGARPNGCGMHLLMQEMSKEGAAAVREAMARPELTHTGIQEALKARGIEIGYTTLARHRMGKCACAREQR